MCSHQKREIWIEWLDIKQGCCYCLEKVCILAKQDRGSAYVCCRIESTRVQSEKRTFHYLFFLHIHIEWNQWWTCVLSLMSTHSFGVSKWQAVSGAHKAKIMCPNIFLIQEIQADCNAISETRDYIYYFGWTALFIYDECAAVLVIIERRQQFLYGLLLLNTKHVVLLNCKFVYKRKTTWKYLEIFACREFVSDWMQISHPFQFKKRLKKAMKDRVKRQIFHIPVLLHRPTPTFHSKRPVLYLSQCCVSVQFFMCSPSENETF